MYMNLASMSNCVPHATHHKVVDILDFIFYLCIYLFFEIENLIFYQYY